MHKMQENQKMLSDNEQDLCKKTVLKKYTEFFYTYNKYFQHCERPFVVFAFEGPSLFNVKMYIFDIVITVCRSKRHLSPAINEIIDVASKFLESYVDVCKTTYTKKAYYDFDNVLVSEAKPRELIKNEKVVAIEDLDKVLEIDEKNNKIDVQGKRPIEIIDELAGSNTIKLCRKSEFNYTELVKNYCIGQKIYFPEYLIEKHNGVFVCTAEFQGENFSSIYAYTKEEAKEGVCKKIFEYIESKNEKSFERNVATVGESERNMEAPKKLKISQKEDLLEEQEIKNIVKDESSPLFINIDDIIKKKDDKKTKPALSKSSSSG